MEKVKKQVPGVPRITTQSKSIRVKENFVPLPEILQHDYIGWLEFHPKELEKGKPREMGVSQPLLPYAVRVYTNQVTWWTYHKRSG